MRALLESLEAPSKSVGHAPYKSVRIPTFGLLSTEPPDGDDTFAPVIASYEVVDGWLIYRGRNGSIGVIVGTGPQLKKWMHDVDSWVAQKPIQDSHPWTSKDGGSSLVKAAVKVARATLRKGGVRAKIEVLVDGGGTRGSASGGTLTLWNVHLTAKRPMLGTSLPEHLAVAAHEAAHLLFHKGGRPVIDALKQYRAQGGTYMSMYHSLSNSDLEGVMEAAAIYMLKPAHLRKKAPGVYAAVLAWLG